MSDYSVDMKALGEKIEEHSSFIDEIRKELDKVIIGQRYMIDRLLIGLLTNGHVLLEGVPGLAKTLTVSSLAQVLSTSFQAAGTIMIHMAAGLGLPLRIATIDTLRLHPETYAFMDELEERYGIAIERRRPDPVQIDAHQLQ